LSTDKVALQRIWEAAEKAKVEISSSSQTEINLQFITTDASGARHLNMTITRSKFEKPVHHLIERTRVPCRNCLKDAGITTSEVDEVILVGGMSRVPRIQQIVSEIFGKMPSKGVNPDEAVARCYDLDVDLKLGIKNISYYSIEWEKNNKTGSWVFQFSPYIENFTEVSMVDVHCCMMYPRADATRGYSGGYHYETRGMMKKLPESPNFKFHLTLNITQGGDPRSQFYLTDIGSCWKNDGRPCDGDVESDVNFRPKKTCNI